MSLDEPSIQFELLPEGLDTLLPKDDDDQRQEGLNEFNDTMTKGIGVGVKSISRKVDGARQKTVDAVTTDGDMVESNDDDDDDDDDDVLDLFAHNNNPESKALLRNHTKIQQVCGHSDIPTSRHTNCLSHNVCCLFVEMSV